MAATVTRFLHTNLVAAAATALADSSEQAGNPKTWLKDPLRSKVLRFARGWTISAGFNDKIDFNRAGVKVATIAAATYTNPTDLCTAIVTALTAADANTWTCTYSTSTFKFTIGGAAAFILLFASGANPTATPALDLGFPLTDTANAVSQVATSASYQSRHWVKIDQGASPVAATAGAVINHNAGVGGTFTLQANATDVWTAPTVPAQVLAGNADIRIAFFSTQTLRYWRLVVNDVQNAAAYGEVGVWFVGAYAQPAITYLFSWKKGWTELSGVQLGTHGALWQDQRPRLRQYTLDWEQIPDADRVAIEAAAAACPMGKPLFLALDAGVDNTNTIYGYFSQGIEVGGDTLLYVNIPGLSFAEAGG